jgi:hypothetical protein
LYDADSSLALATKPARTERALPSTSVQGNALRPTNEVVDKGANHVRENDDHDPNNLVVSLTRLFRRALHDHPNPENQGGDSETEKKQHEAGSHHSQPPNPNGSHPARRIRIQALLYTAHFRKLLCPGFVVEFSPSSDLTSTEKPHSQAFLTQAA